MSLLSLRLPLRGRWQGEALTDEGKSPTLSWERVAGPKALTGVGR